VPSIRNQRPVQEQSNRNLQREQVLVIRNRIRRYRRFRVVLKTNHIRHHRKQGPPEQSNRNRPLVPEQNIRNRLQVQLRSRKMMQQGRSSCLHRKSACRCRRIRSRRFCQQFYPSIRRHIHNSVLSELRKTSIQLGQACGPKVRNRSWCRS